MIYFDVDATDAISNNSRVRKTFKNHVTTFIKLAPSYIATSLSSSKKTIYSLNKLHTKNAVEYNKALIAKTKYDALFDVNYMSDKINLIMDMEAYANIVGMLKYSLLNRDDDVMESLLDLLNHSTKIKSSKYSEFYKDCKISNHDADSVLVTLQETDNILDSADELNEVSVNLIVSATMYQYWMHNVSECMDSHFICNRATFDRLLNFIRNSSAADEYEISDAIHCDYAYKCQLKEQKSLRTLDSALSHLKNNTISDSIRDAIIKAPEYSNNHYLAIGLSELSDIMLISSDLVMPTSDDLQLALATQYDDERTSITDVAFNTYHLVKNLKIGQLSDSQTNLMYDFNISSKIYQVIVNKRVKQVVMSAYESIIKHRTELVNCNDAIIKAKSIDDVVTDYESKLQSLESQLNNAIIERDDAIRDKTKFDTLEHKLADTTKQLSDLQLELKQTKSALVDSNKQLELAHELYDEQVPDINNESEQLSVDEMYQLINRNDVAIVGGTTPFAQATQSIFPEAKVIAGSKSSTNMSHIKNCNLIVLNLHALKHGTVFKLMSNMSNDCKIIKISSNTKSSLQRSLQSALYAKQ